MPVEGDKNNWEDTLDRELAGATWLSPAIGQTVRDRQHAGDAPIAPEPPDENESMSLSQLRSEVFDSIREGQPLSVDIYDGSGSLLQPAGSPITKRFLQRLRERGVRHVRIRAPRSDRPDGHDDRAEDTPPPEDLHTALSRGLDERLAGELSRPVEYRPVKRWRRPRLSIDDLKGQAAQGAEQHAVTSEAVAGLCYTLQPGRRVSVDRLQASINQFIDIATVDFDVLPLIVAMQASGDEYLFDHCVNVSLISIAMASNLGMNRERVMEIGLGGLLHDIGMLRVPLSIRMAPRGLTDQEWHEVHRHPLHSLDMLAGFRGIPQTAKFISYQVHERFDGAGYPRGRLGGQLHEYAKIVSIADVYTAMTRHRPHRPPVPPYQAARTILKECAASKYDSALVRAFLDTVSLFPIGSRVKLANSSLARVLRANPGLHTRPVVEELGEDGTPTGRLFDLSDDDAPSVVQAVD